MKKSALNRKSRYIMSIGLLMLTLLLSLPSQAQLTIYAGSASGSGWTLDSLVSNVLLGEGVEVFNVQFNGNGGALNCTSIGRFTGGATSGIQMGSGIVMATGSVAHVTSTTGVATSSNCSNYTGATPLDPLAGSTPIYDKACLEFDFVCKSDSINFRYVFASEEYPSFVCSSYNDIFGFFLTGVAPAGMGFSMYQDYNIALIPNSTNIVSINTVNGGTSAGSASPCILTNTQYFTANPSGTAYGGCTTVLTAKAKVLPCHTYHIKLVIADLGDNSYDSAVFLEANSLRSNGITPVFTNTANPQNPTLVYEGCCADIVLSRPEARSINTSINVSISGTASNGEDYQYINPVMGFPADSNSITLRICPYQDSTTEGTETVVIILNPSDGCPDTVSFSILDTDPIGIDIVCDSLHSGTSRIPLQANITGGMPNRTVTWVNRGTNATMTGETVTVQPVVVFNDIVPANAWWDAYVEDFCYNTASDSVCVAIRRNFAMLRQDTTICASYPLTLSIAGLNMEHDSVAWFLDGNLISGQHRDTIIVFPTEGRHTYTSYSYKWFNGQYWLDVDSVHVVGIALPDMHVTASRTEICPGETVTLTGSGVSTYSWDNGQTYTATNTHTYSLDSTQMIHVYGLSASAGCPGTDSILITVDYVPQITITSSGNICGGGTVILNVETDATTFEWSSAPADPSLNDQVHSGSITVSPDVTTVYTVTAYYGVCSHQESETIAVEPMPVAIGEVNPTTVSLGNMEAIFTDRSLNSSSRLWHFPDGSEYTTPEVHYVVSDDMDTVEVMLVAFNPYLCSDTTWLYVYVDHSTLWAPNAFMPDEMSNNRFEVKMNAIRDYYIRIFDRQGHLVFASTDPTEYWDGTNRSGHKCPQGSYVYFISVHKAAPPHDQQTYSGTVTIIR